jgi:signal transduction histidine kinase
MKESPLDRLSEHYLATLRTLFEQSPQATCATVLQAAHALGKEAVSIGLETLDLARIHDHSLAQLLLACTSAATRENWTARAAVFFTEAITLIEVTHRGALSTNAALHQLNATLDERSLDLAASNRQLQRQIAGRAAAETALKDSQLSSSALLNDSQCLERQLQEMARTILSATEAERKKMGVLLNDEVAQTLLGINIRMLALKNEVTADHTHLTQEIATIQRLVEDSTRIISRLAHEFSIQHA